MKFELGKAFEGMVYDGQDKEQLFDLFWTEYQQNKPNIVGVNDHLAYETFDECLKNWTAEDQIKYRESLAFVYLDLLSHLQDEGMARLKKQHEETPLGDDHNAQCAKCKYHEKNRLFRFVGTIRDEFNNEQDVFACPVCDSDYVSEFPSINEQRQAKEIQERKDLEAEAGLVIAMAESIAIRKTIGYAEW